MSEEQQQSSTPEAPAEEAPQMVESSGESTPEAIEAYWRNRISGTDKKRVAAEAELKVLKERLGAAESGAQAPAGGASGTEAPATNELVTRLQQEVEAERKGRVTDLRTLKYPAAAEALGDPSLLTTMDEGKLAALDAQLRVEAPRQRPVADTNPQRTVAPTTKPMAEMSKDELKAYLRTLPAPSVD